MSWLEDAQARFNDYERWEEGQKHRLSIDSMGSIPESLEGITDLNISSRFEGNPMDFLPKLLSKGVEVKRLHVYGQKELTWDEICALPLSRIEELKFSMKGPVSGTMLFAPKMTSLCIFGTAGLTPLEIMINPMPHIDFSGTPNLERLELRHFQQVDPSDFKELRGLKHLFISEASFEDLIWLNEATYRLNSLVIDGSLESCSGLECQAELAMLSLYHGFFTDISPIESLTKLKELDLRYNDLDNEGNLRNLGIRKLIITRQDQDIYRVQQEVYDMVKWAVGVLRGQNKQNLEGMPEFRRRYHLQLINPPFEERMKALIQCDFDGRIQRALDEDHPIGIRMNKDEYLSMFTKMAVEYCPFLKVKEGLGISSS